MFLAANTNNDVSPVTESNPSIRRTAVACDACRRRKIKCDGTRPYCLHCQKLSKVCHYAAFVETRKRKAPDARRPIDVEDELVKWKRYAQNLQASYAQVVTTSGVNSAGAVTRNSKDLLGQVDEDEATESALDVTKTMKPSSSHVFEEPQKPLKPHSYRALDDISKAMTKTLTEQQEHTASTRPGGVFTLSESVVCDAYEAYIDSEDVSLPIQFDPLFVTFTTNLALKRHLIKIFMDRLNSVHLFVDTFTLLSPEAYPHRELDVQLLHTAIFASAAGFCDDRNTKIVACLLMKHAESIALTCSRIKQTITTVKALIILCTRELSHHHDDTANIYLSMADTLAINLGLYTISHQSESCSKLGLKELNDQIRTFWSYFLLNRATTTIVGRHKSLPTPCVHTKPYASIYTADLHLEEVAFDLHCKIWLMYDKYMVQANLLTSTDRAAGKDEILLLEARVEFLSFHDKIDNRLRFSKNNMPVSAVILQMSYQLAILLIHRPYITPGEEGGICLLALETMTVSASIMTQLILVFRKRDVLKNLPPFLIHHVMVAIIMHLMTATYTKEQAQLRNKIAVCLSALEQLQGNWPRARRALLSCQELAKRWDVVSFLPMRLSNVDVMQGNAASTVPVELRQPSLNLTMDGKTNTASPMPSSNSSTAYTPDWPQFAMNTSISIYEDDPFTLPDFNVNFTEQLYNPPGPPSDYIMENFINQSVLAEFNTATRG